MLTRCASRLSVSLIRTPIARSAMTMHRMRGMSGDAVHTHPQSSGAKTGQMPSNEQQAVGKEYEEMMEARKGLERFESGGLTGPFGTMDKPVIVYTGNPSRVVGCVGGGGYAHRLLWFELKHGKKHVCRECGQVFKLAPVEEQEAKLAGSSSHSHATAHAHH